MTPLLLLSGFPAHIAIGTDLIYAALKKDGGVWTHHRQRSVGWKLVKAMCAGSIPSIVITVFILKYMFARIDHYSSILTTCLGFMLILTATVLLLRKYLLKFFWQYSDVPGITLPDLTQILLRYTHFD